MCYQTHAGSDANFGSVQTFFNAKDSSFALIYRWNRMRLDEAIRQVTYAAENKRWDLVEVRDFLYIVGVLKEKHETGGTTLKMIIGVLNYVVEKGTRSP